MLINLWLFCYTPVTVSDIHVSVLVCKHYWHLFQNQPVSVTGIFVAVSVLLTSTSVPVCQYVTDICFSHGMSVCYWHLPQPQFASTLLISVSVMMMSVCYWHLPQSQFANMLLVSVSVMVCQYVTDICLSPSLPVCYWYLFQSWYVSMLLTSASVLCLHCFADALSLYFCIPCKPCGHE